MSLIEEARNEFYLALEGLKIVYTMEELEAQKKKVEKAEKHLLEVDLDFRAMNDERERKMKIKNDMIRTEHKAKKRDIKMQIHSIQKYADRLRMEAIAKYDDKDVDEWVKNHRLKIRSREEAESQINEDLWCPICQEKNTSNNTINGVPTCFKHWHKLVPRSNLKHYNRKYRRNWKHRRYKT